jgi:hypothetical protein
LQSATQDLATTRARSFGLKRLTPDELARIPVGPEPSAEVLLQVKATTAYDTRANLHAQGIDCQTWTIADQGQCGACYAFAANRVYAA